MMKKYIEVVYTEYYASLLHYALSLTNNRYDAEELVSYAFEKALLSFKGGHLKAWMFTVIRNEFYNQAKVKKRFVYNGEEMIQREKHSKQTYEEVVANEDKRWLYKSLNTFSQKEKDVVLLAIVAELSDSEIAQTTGLTIENVRVIKHRVKKKLIIKAKEEKQNG